MEQWRGDWRHSQKIFVWSTEKLELYPEKSGGPLKIWFFSRVLLLWKGKPFMGSLFLLADRFMFEVQVYFLINLPSYIIHKLCKLNVLLQQNGRTIPGRSRRWPFKKVPTISSALCHTLSPLILSSINWEEY